MTHDGAAEDAMVVGGGRRLAVAPDALSVEVRGGGKWIRTRVLPYEDIRAVYRYEQLDTRALVALAFVWLVLLVVLLIAGAVAQWPGMTIGLVAIVLTLVLSVLGFVRARTAPARMLRIEAYSGVMIVPDASPTFYQSITARIRISQAAPVSFDPQPSSYAEPSAMPVNPATDSSESG